MLPSVRRATSSDRERWLELRAAFDPQVPRDVHDAAISFVLANAGRAAAFVHEREHAGIICAGLASIAFTDVFSADLLRGGLLPWLNLMFVIYIILLFASRRLRRSRRRADELALTVDGGIIPHAPASRPEAR